MNTLTISFISIGVYLATLAYKSINTFKNRQSTTGVAVISLLAVCLALHAFTLYSHLMNHPEGINLGIFNIASLVSWFILCIVWLCILRNIEIDNTLFFIIPLCVICLIANEYFPAVYYSKESFSSGLLLHIILSIFAYSILSIACIQALLLFMQEANLKNQRNMSALNWLPPLQTMEDLLFNMITLGLILLSVSIATGALFIDDVFAQQLSHKLVFTLVSWLIFTALLAGRYFYGWRGLTAIKWTIAGFIALMLAYFGSKFVLEVVLMKQ